jgi:hypothetical protein
MGRRAERRACSSARIRFRRCTMQGGVQMFRIELDEVVIERVAMHEVRGVGSGKKIEVLAQRLVGAGRGFSLTYVNSFAGSRSVP